MSQAIRARRPDVDVRGKLPDDVTQDDLAWADAYMGFKAPPAVAHMGNVRWVQCTGAGVDGWASLSAEVVLTRSSEAFGPMIAEWVLARVFAVQLQVLDLASAQRESRWAPREIARVAATRALVVGTGQVGSAIALALRAVGVHVVGVSRTGAAAECSAFSAVHASSELAALVSDVDWLVLAVPDTPASRGLISPAVLARCRGAVLLNVGRGSAVDEAAMLAALDDGRLRAAALDVFATEPLPADSPIWTHPRVLVSPHISGQTTAAGAAAAFLDALDALERGEAPATLVDRGRGY